MIASYPHFDGFNCVFNITEDCNLACKYCYEINKKNKIISKEHIIKFINIILDDDNLIGVSSKDEKVLLDRGLILDFLGGDALMHPDIIDFTLKYFNQQAVLKQHKWAFNWRASICSNGTLFNNKGVIKLLNDYGHSISLGISIDGCPEIHDLNRVYKDGRPTMATILKYWNWYKDWCNDNGCVMSTKATLNKQSIPYLYKSLKFLHEELNFKYINMNFAMEDVGLDDSDCKLLDEQLEECMPYVLQHKDDLYWSFIDRHFSEAKKMNDDNKDKGRCGSGFMLSLSVDGEIYPCFRWLPASMNSKWKSFSCGNVNDGLYNKNSLLEIRAATREVISDEECKNCILENSCSYCIAGCYNEFGCFKRTKYICGVTKIQHKWSKYYWNIIDKELSDESKIL